MHADFYYRTKLLAQGDLRNALEKAIETVMGPKAEIKVSHPRHTDRRGISDNIDLDLESVTSIVDLSKVKLSVTAILRGENYSRADIWLWSHRSGVIHFSGTGEASVQCLERVAISLSLDVAEPPRDDFEVAFETLTSRVTELENVAKNVERKMKCFISFKLNDSVTVASVDRLKRLLSAIRVEWLTGEQFEPRRIEDKVRARLRSDVDFVIAVISSAGESKWIRDELADAQARGLWMVLLVEEGATFDKGIFGTLEYLRYESSIEQTFPELLEGINFIRAEISTRVEHHRT